MIRGAQIAIGPNPRKALHIRLLRERFHGRRQVRRNRLTQEHFHIRLTGERTRSRLTPERFHTRPMEERTRSRLTPERFHTRPMGERTRNRTMRGRTQVRPMRLFPWLRAPVADYIPTGSREWLRR